MKTKFITPALIFTFLNFALILSAQNPQSYEAGKSPEDYELSFRKHIQSDSTLKETTKASSFEYVEKLSKDIKLNKQQEDSLFIIYNEFMQRLQFSNKIELEEDKQNYRLLSSAIYSNAFATITNDNQKANLQKMIKRKSEEKNFTPYLEDHKDEYKTTKSE